MKESLKTKMKDIYSTYRKVKALHKLNKKYQKAKRKIYANRGKAAAIATVGTLSAAALLRKRKKKKN